MSTSMWAMLGGALGALTRYYLGLVLSKWTRAASLPLAILLINGFGSFFLGLLLSSTLAPGGASTSANSPWLSFAALGFCGAFTTFSTFSIEALQLWQKEKVKEFFLYISLTLVISVTLFSIAIQL